METPTCNSCLLFTNNTNTHNDEFGIVGLQTDDNLTVGNDGFLRKENEAIKKAGFIHKPLEMLTPGNDINFNGSIISLHNDNIIVTQKHQISGIRKKKTS